VISLHDAGICQTCTVEVTPLLTLGDEAGPGIIEHSESRAVRDSRGRSFVVGSYSTEIKVFDSTGTYLRSIGRQGSGPAEFEGIARVIIEANDTVFVLDNMLNRYSVISPELEFMRSGPLPFPPELQSIRLADGSFVMNVPLHTPDRIGQPLHLGGTDGLIAKSFGSATGEYRPGIEYSDRRAIAVAGAQSVWSARRNQYSIEEIDVRTANVVRSLSRYVPWFPPRDRPTPPSGPDPAAPEPTIMNVRQDRAGLLWLLIAVPDPEWRRAVTEAA
jgi:hypothetical protein